MKLSFAAAAAILASTAAASPVQAETAAADAADAAALQNCHKVTISPADKAVCGPPGGDEDHRLRVQLKRTDSGLSQCYDKVDLYSVTVSYTESWWKNAQTMLKGFNHSVKSISGIVEVANPGARLYNFDFDIKYDNIYPGTPVNITVTKFNPQGKDNIIHQSTFTYQGPQGRKHVIDHSIYAAPECDGPL